MMVRENDRNSSSGSPRRSPFFCMSGVSEDREGREVENKRR